MVNKLIENTTPIKPIRKTKEERAAQAASEGDHLKVVKAKVKELERDNFKKLIAFTSGNPWYKLGFNSALIYEYQVMPHLKTVYFRPHEDNDHYSFSKAGIVSISDIVSFADIMVKMGASIPESLQKYFMDGQPTGERPAEDEREDTYIFELNGMTRAKLEEFHKAKNRDINAINELLLPAYLPTELYPDLHALAQEIMKLITRLSPPIRDTYGVELMKLSMNSLRDINATCNGYGTAADFRSVLKTTAFRMAEIQEIIRTMLDCGVIKMGYCQMVVGIAINVQKDAKRELDKFNKNESSFVRAIKEAKNFPVIKGLEATDKIARQNPDKSGYIETIPPKEV